LVALIFEALKVRLVMLWNGRLASRTLPVYAHHKEDTVCGSLILPEQPQQLGAKAGKPINIPHKSPVLVPPNPSVVPLNLSA
jgi:hypothetical protein